MALQSLDIIRRSATTLPEPEVRGAYTGQVAKLIDTTKCIGCKACQVACMEWNDLRDEIGTCTGHYDNPHDLSEDSWTLMRFIEYENPKGDLEWLIRKDGCMHCEDPGCLKACPSPGRDRAVRERHRRFPRGELHRLRLLRRRGVRSTFRASRRRTKKRTNARSVRTGSPWVSSPPASKPARPGRSCSAPRRI